MDFEPESDAEMIHNSLFLGEFESEDEKLMALSTFLNNSMSNWTNADVDPGLSHRYITNRRIEGPIFFVIILIYSLLIVFGALGNLLVISAVARKKTMRTARNMFIINLAISDLLLCGLTMPLTLVEILTMYWPLGQNVFLCKIFGSLQAISIFVSTVSITAIALDRYHVIVYPTKPSVQRCGAIAALGIIWFVSCLLAAPLFIWRRLAIHQLMGYESYGLTSIIFCFEEFPIENGRAWYSIGTILIQYFLPIIVVSMAYARICKKLRYRMRPGGGGRLSTTTHSQAMQSQSVAPDDVESKKSNLSSKRSKRSKRGKSGLRRESTVVIEKDKNRVQRTNTLLISIALIFGISWLPLNLFNVIVDLWDPLNSDKDTYMYIYAVCHMCGMSSACSNPVLYGWLNENFRKEFKEIISNLSDSCSCHIIRDRTRTLNGIIKGPGAHNMRTQVTQASEHDPEEIVVHFNKKKNNRMAKVSLKGFKGHDDGHTGQNDGQNYADDCDIIDIDAEDRAIEKSTLITQVIDQK